MAAEDRSPAREEMPTTNEGIAAMFREMAELLAGQGANAYRVEAYRRAAHTAETLDEPLAGIFEARGPEGLDALPTIGKGLASAIAEILITGRWSQLERLRGSVDSVAAFCRVPGVDAALAGRLHEVLHVDTLEALEQAARRGRLAELPELRGARAARLATSVSQTLDSQRVAHRAAPVPPAEEPSVALLLDIDAEYRRKAAEGRLPKIAPRRFNPRGEAWLPVMHTDRGGWHFTAMFSNTERAHALGKTHDWVIVYFHDDEHVERQHTVVTETRGSLEGLRVVRGREADCLTQARR